MTETLTSITLAGIGYFDRNLDFNNSDRHRSLTDIWTSAFFGRNGANYGLDGHTNASWAFFLSFFFHSLIFFFSFFLFHRFSFLFFLQVFFFLSQNHSQGRSHSKNHTQKHNEMLTFFYMEQICSR
jgi:hypothetical protein